MTDIISDQTCNSSLISLENNSNQNDKEIITQESIEEDEDEEDVYLQMNECPYNRSFIYFYIWTITLGSIHIGYIEYEINIKNDHSNVMYIITFSGLAIGAFLSNYFLEIGRRKALIFGNLVVIISSILVTAFINNIKLVFLFQAILSICVGLFMVIPPIIVREVAPVEISGAAIQIHCLQIFIGCCFCSGFDYFINPQRKKYIISSFPILVGIAQILLIFFYFKNETPKFLILKKQMQKCEKCLIEIYSDYFRIGEELKCLIEAREDNSNRHLKWSDLVKKPFAKIQIVALLIASFNEIEWILQNLMNEVYKKKYEKDYKTDGPFVYFVLNLACIVCALIAMNLADLSRKKVLYFGVFLVSIFGFILIFGFECFDLLNHLEYFLGIYSVCETMHDGFIWSIIWTLLADLLPAKGFIICTLAMLFLDSFVYGILRFVIQSSDDIPKIAVTCLAGAIEIILLIIFLFVRNYIPETKGLREKQIKDLFREKI